jgi:hypothetical protein
MKEERISRISGVNYINGLINEDPLKYDLSTFMNLIYALDHFQYLLNIQIHYQ